MTLIDPYIVASCFDRVIMNSGQRNQDYWFVWTDDYEPIRLEFRTTIEDNEISSAISRFHWKHITVENPYRNNFKVREVTK